MDFYKIFSIIVSIITIIVITMFTIGAIYEIPDNSMYVEIFKIIFIIWISGLSSWLIIAFYREFND